MHIEVTWTVVFGMLHKVHRLTVLQLVERLSFLLLKESARNPQQHTRQ